MKVKVLKIDQYEIEFENGFKLCSEHNQDCCETHSLSLSDLTLKDFAGLEFDLLKDDFFKRIDGYGIELVPIKGHSVKIAGHGMNNGYYSSDMRLVIIDGKGFRKEYDITECQVINDNC